MLPEYVDFLFAEYLEKKNLNFRYSERAFARSVGLSPGFLKLLFQGKKQLGLSRAKEIADRLDWTQPKKIKFLKSVQATSSKTSKLLSGKFLLDDKDFFEISDWYHFAIVELIKVKRGSITINEICSHLKLSKTEVIFALKQLLKLQIIQEDGSSEYKVPENYEMPSVSSEGIRKYHRQMLALASAAIEVQSMDQRDLRGLTLSFDIKKIDEAKKEIQKFTASFEKKFGSNNGNSVYQLSLALFRLDKEEA